MDLNGWLLFDKPIGWSSFQVVKLARNVLGAKVGHCGTLDPFASGALLLALGQATKLASKVMLMQKHYFFTVKWGTGTNTVDITGKCIRRSHVKPTTSDIRSILPAFLGNIEQSPPSFSAIQINGVRSYKYARLGNYLRLKEKIVQVKKIMLTEHTASTTSFYLISGKGFYVRSFARDIAWRLKACCHVIKLRRQTGMMYKNKMVSIQRKDYLQIKQMYVLLLENVLPINCIS